jgi:hypothetical protein
MFSFWVFSLAAPRELWTFQTWATVVAAHGAILFESWQNRHRFGCVAKHLQSLLKPKTLDPRLSRRLGEMRVMQTAEVYRIIKFAACVAMIAIIWGMQPHETPPMMGILAHMVRVYLIGFAFLEIGHVTERKVDITFWLVNFAGLYRTAFCILGVTLHVSSMVRVALRAWTSVAYMKSHVSCPVNLLQSLVACWAYTKQPVDDSLAYSRVSPTHILFLCETVSWFCTSMLCVVTETWFKDFLRSELLAHDAAHDVQRLLSSLCECGDWVPICALPKRHRSSCTFCRPHCL